MADFGLATLAVAGGGSSGGQALQLPAGADYSQWGAVAYMAPEVGPCTGMTVRLLPAAARPLTVVAAA